MRQITVLYRPLEELFYNDSFVINTLFGKMTFLSQVGAVSKKIIGGIRLCPSNTLRTTPSGKTLQLTFVLYQGFSIKQECSRGRILARFYVGQRKFDVFVL